MALKGKKKFKNKNIFESIKYGFIGIIYAFKEERNIKLGALLAFIIIVLGFIFGLSNIEWCICLLSSGLVISFEMVNTAIEKAIDIAMPNVHPLAKIAKDVSAGAVVFLILISIVNACLILVPKIIEMM
ncbi:MAG: diacylglycerol kinase family protein [Bacilli bacterium]|nr:diacylglycerol kinase family protein [Bacilli bacterium]